MLWTAPPCEMIQRVMAECGYCSPKSPYRAKTLEWKIWLTVLRVAGVVFLVRRAMTGAEDRMRMAIMVGANLQGLSVKGWCMDIMIRG